MRQFHRKGRHVSTIIYDRDGMQQNRSSATDVINDM